MGKKKAPQPLAKREVIARHDLSELAAAMQRGPFISFTPQSTAERARVLNQAGMDVMQPFSPGQPLMPLYGDDPAVRYQYIVGQNVALQPRSEVPGAVAFSILREMSKHYDVARLCINVRIEEITNLDFDITYRDERDKGTLDDTRREIRRFFEKPDGVTPFDRWLSALMDDWLSIDALTIYRHRNRKGDRLVALEVVDGSTIKPLLDGRGRTPLPPAPAYQQFLWGIPFEEYTIRDILYRPYWTRSYSPYGFPPLEWLLVNVNTDIRLQWHFLYYFTAGNVPEGFGTTPEGWTPQQIKEWQEMWDALMQGDPRMKRQIRWVPYGFDFKEFRQTPFDPAFPEYLMRKTCAAFGVAPQEIGFTAQINKASADLQENVHFRRLIQPSVDFLESIFNEIIAEDFGLPQLRFTFTGYHEEEDALSRAQRYEIMLRNGVISPDEWRAIEGFQVDAEKPAGRVFIGGGGPVPLDLIYASPPAETVARPDSMVPGDQPVSRPAEQEEPSDPDEAMKADLRRWERKALGRLKDGKRPLCKFESGCIPSDVALKIRDGLEAASTAEEVKAVFAKAAPPTDPDEGGAPWLGIATRLLALWRQFLAQEAQAARKFILDRFEEVRSSEPTSAKAAEKLLNDFPWAGWAVSIEGAARELAEAYRAGARGALANLYSAGIHGAFDVRNLPAEAYARQRAAELVGKRVLPDGRIVDNPRAEMAITQSTREMIRGDIVRAIEEGWSPQDLADYLASHYAFSDRRAMVIARTETGFAYNRGAVDSYREAGIAKVRVVDGVQWDEPCRQANGQVWDLEYAYAHPLEHPRCTRAFLPVVEVNRDAL